LLPSASADITAVIFVNRRLITRAKMRRIPATIARPPSSPPAAIQSLICRAAAKSSAAERLLENTPMTSPRFSPVACGLWQAWQDP
jgi:hypothetical protein